MILAYSSPKSHWNGLTKENKYESCTRRQGSIKLLNDVLAEAITR